MRNGTLEVIPLFLDSHTLCFQLLELARIVFKIRHETLKLLLTTEQHILRRLGAFLHLLQHLHVRTLHVYFHETRTVSYIARVEVVQRRLKCSDLTLTTANIMVELVAVALHLFALLCRLNDIVCLGVLFRISCLTVLRGKSAP